MIDCYIGLGSNLGNSLDHIQQAFTQLAALPDSVLKARSSLYGSKAIGPGPQGNYINAAAQLRTGLEAEALLNHLQRIEQQHGRERHVRWAARTLDLDLLIYGDAKITNARLTVPHPGIGSRPFVLAPLAELQATLPGIALGQAFDYLSADSLWLIQPNDEDRNA